MRIVFFDIDTMRADHLGCYGYHRNTSPNIDRLAADGVRFENYYASDAPCLPSRTALMSGQFGIHTGVVGHGGTAADFRLEGSPRSFRTTLDQHALPRIFTDCGIKPVLVSPFAERHSSFTFYCGFREMHNTGRGGGESAEEITPVVLKWIAENAAEDNWYLHINYWDPHTNYRAPADFGEPFADDPLPAWLTDEVIAQHQQAVGPHSAREIAMYSNRTSPQCPRQPGEVVDRASLRKQIDGYDTGIRYADHHVGLVLDALAAQGVLDDAVIIVSTDHGENQGEFGIYGEHATADQPTCRIPMIIRWPGKQRGHVDRGLHYNLDLAPTLAELLGRKPFPIWDGQSYAPALETGADCGRDYVVISQCCHVCQRSVRFDDWLYMRTYHDGYHLFPSEMLFNLADDPYQQHDLAQERHDICLQGCYLLNEWHDEQMHKMSPVCDVDPLWTVVKEGGPFHARGQLSKYCEWLDQTDRGWAVPELKQRHPREFKD